MRRTAELGTVVVGQRADLVLLSSDPLKSVANTSSEHIEGVMVRGIWLPADVLATFLEKIAAVYGEPAGRSWSRAEVDAAVDTLARLRAQGWTLRTHRLRRLRDQLVKSGLAVDEGLFSGIDAASD
jgi:hypothetical protein